MTTTFRDIKVGDIAIRNFVNELQEWGVTEVTDTQITIGMGWTFNRDTGIEEDEDCPSIGQISRLVDFRRTV